MHAAVQSTTHQRPIFIPFILSYSLLCRSHTSLDQLIFEPIVSVWVMQRLIPQCTHTSYHLYWSHLIGPVGYRILAQEKWHNKTVKPINPLNCDSFNDYFVSILFYWRSQTHRTTRNTQQMCVYIKKTLTQTKYFYVIVGKFLLSRKNVHRNRKKKNNKKQ